MSFSVFSDITTPEAPAPTTTPAPPTDYWGWAPGMDLGDVFAGLDAGGRGGRTLVSSLLDGQGMDSFGRAGEAILDSEKAASIGDIKGQLGIPTFGTEGDGFFREGGPANWDYGDVADTVIDTLGNTVTDPFAYLNFGTTAAGNTALKAGQKLISAGVGKAGVLSPEMRAAAIKQFTKSTGRELAEDFVPHQDWRGIGDTFGQRLSQGDVGLGFQVPFMPSTRTELAIPKALQVAGGAVADPLSLAGEGLATTGLGKQVGKGVEHLKNTLLNPNVRGAFGLAARNAENIRRQAVDELSSTLDTLDVRMADAGLPVEKWNLAHRLTELTEFDEEAFKAGKRGVDTLTGKVDVDADKRAAEEYAGVVTSKNTREAAGEKTLQEKYAETVAEINALNPKQRSAIYDASETFHRMNTQMRDRAAELGIPFAEMGKEVDNKIADRRRALTRLEQQIDDAVQAHTIKNRPPEADPNAGRTDIPDSPSPAPSDTGIGGVSDSATGSGKPIPQGVAERGSAVGPTVESKLGGAGNADARFDNGTKGLGAQAPVQGSEVADVPPASAEVPQVERAVERPAPVVPGRSRTAAATEAAAAKRDAARSTTPILDRVSKLPEDRQAVMFERTEQVAAGEKVNLKGLNDEEKKILGEVLTARKNLVRQGRNVDGLSSDELKNAYEESRRARNAGTIDPETGKPMGVKTGSLDEMQDNGVSFSLGDKADEEIRLLSEQNPRLPIVLTKDGWRHAEAPKRDEYDWTELLQEKSPEQLRREYDDRFREVRKLVGTDQHIKNIADALGIDVRFYENMADARGIYVRRAGDRFIGLLAGMDPSEAAHTLGHEFTHQAFSRLGATGTEAMLNAAAKILGSDFDDLIGRITQRYAKSGMELSPDKALEEILVDAGGKLFRDDGLKWISEAAQIDPTIYQRFVGIIKDMLNKVKTIISQVPKDKQEGLQVLARRLQNMEIRALEMKKSMPMSEGMAARESFSLSEADPYSIPKNELPDDIQAMMKERDAVRNEVERLEQLKRESPSYAPHVINSKLDVVRSPGNTGPDQLTRGVKSKERKLGFNTPEGKVPYTREEAEAYYKKMGGSKATMGEVQKEDARIGAAFKAITTKNGLKELKDNLKDLSLFEENPILAYAKRIESFGKQMSNAMMQRNLTNTFRAVPHSAWTEAIDGAKAGLSEDEIRSAFQKATGQKIDDFVSKDVPLLDRLKSDIPATPSGYQQVINQADESAVWLPAGIADRYRRYLETQKKGPEMLGAIGGLLQTFTKYWKMGQTMFFPDFHIRNTIGDTWRMAQEDAIDGGTMRDIGGMTDALIRAGKRGIAGVDPNAMIDLGPGGVVPLQSFLKQVEGEGLWNTGQLSEQMTKKIDDIIARQQGKKVTDMPARWLAQANNVLAQRENVMKAAAVATRMRKGDTLLEATLRAEEALFNYSSVSPAVDWLRKTGAAPFLAWTAKNVPAQLEWAIRNPGKLAALTRAYASTSEEGGLSEAALPEYMQDKHNLVMSKSKDAKGNTVWNVATTEGLIPVDDILSLTANPAKSFKGMIGPLLKAANEITSGPDKPGREGTVFSDTADALAGKPLRTLKNFRDIGAIDPRTGESTGLGATMTSFINPMKVKAIKVEEALKKSEQQSKSRLGQFRNKLRDATVALADNEAAAQMDGNGEGGIEIPYWGDELRRLRNAVTLAQQEYQREQARHDAESKTNARMMKRAQELSRAP